MIWVARLGFLLLLLVVWALAAQQFGQNVVPSPLATYEAARRMIDEGRLQSAFGASLFVYLWGFSLAVLCAIPVGVAMGGFRLLGKTLEVYVFALAATPRVAFIPLIIMTLGLGADAKIFVVFLGALMPVLISTYAGILAADEELVEMARSTGASRQRIFLEIVLPGAVPFVLTGMRIGATIGLINTVVAELYTAVTGLGGLLALFGNTFRMAEYFVVVLTLALIGVVVTESLRLLEQRFLRWKGDN
jgi:ABC-type nitrate/sulfonate/bicarbonate transport system permease component